MSLMNPGAKQFLCASCKELAHNAMILDCNVGHHNQQLALYCSKCASIHSQKCPLNHHPHPIFKPAIQQRLEMDELDVMCPYSIKQVIAQQHNDEDKEDEVFLYDTDCGRITSPNDNEGMNISNQNNQYDIDLSSSNEQKAGCEWIGKYKYLQHHLDECNFIPIDHELLRLKTQFQALKHDMIQSKAKHRSCRIKSIVLTIVIILLFIGAILKNYTDTKCSYNEFDDEMRKYIDNLINEKYDKMEGFQYILKGDLNAFQNAVIDAISTKLNELDSMDRKEGIDGDSKYGIIDDIVANAKSKYDGYKNQIDSIPFVQFVSNALNSFKKEDLEQEL